MRTAGAHREAIAKPHEDPPPGQGAEHHEEQREHHGGECEVPPVHPFDAFADGRLIPVLENRPDHHPEDQDDDGNADERNNQGFRSARSSALVLVMARVDFQDAIAGRAQPPPDSAVAAAGGTAGRCPVAAATAGRRRRMGRGISPSTLLITPRIEAPLSIEQRPPRRKSQPSRGVMNPAGAIPGLQVEL